MKLHLGIVTILALSLGLATPLAAQPRAARLLPEPGRLLVAAPDMKDPNFAGTVMLLLRTGPKGAIGVVINRPTWVAPGQVDRSLDVPESYAGKVYRGGPLAASQLIYLVRNPPADMVSGEPLLDNVYVGGDPEVFNTLAQKADTRQLRLFAGHAAWPAGQLERELAAKRWRVVAGKADWLFSANPELLWHQITHEGSEVVVDAGLLNRREARLAGLENGFRALRKEAVLGLNTVSR